jgi:lycopene beta-cyclase
MMGHGDDIAILGGGLAGGLIALALARLRPDLRISLIEAEERFGGNHLWSFFASDIPDEAAWLVDPLIAARWDGYEVRFPTYQRTLPTTYCTASSEMLDAELRRVLPAEALRTGTRVIGFSPYDIMLDDGHATPVGGVIDARGVTGLPHMRGGWQKFLGRMLRLKAPHGLTQPIIMDAGVEQCGAFRFVYCLPFSETEIFVEDTYYADAPDLDLPLLGERITRYCEQQGWGLAEILREERGVLPVIAEGDFDAFWPADPHLTARAGTRAALAHPLTSYSLPSAVLFALYIASQPDLSGVPLAAASRKFAKRHWRQGRFYRMLTRLLFGAADPEGRYKVLERFYNLPPPLIERFYAGNSTPADKLNILSGKSPVPVGAALASMVGRRTFAPLETPE